MKRMCLVVPTVVLGLVGLCAPSASGADQKMVRGTITAVTADSVSISAGSQAMTFAVDNRTHVEAPGAGTQSRAAQAAGKPGAKLTDLVRTGESIEVWYRESNGALDAMNIRRISKMPELNAAALSEARGTVTAVSATSVTIAGSSGPGTFSQTYAVDANTRVIGKGVGTATAASGGRASITNLVAVGDSVSVAYRGADDGSHATEIRISR
jgi:hypothetical protein